MAKVTNPLFSLSASGTMGRTVFCNTGSAVSARKKPFALAVSATPAQLEVRAKCRAAASAWKNLEQIDRDEWIARGVNVRFSTDRENPINLSNGWALWLQEWMIQQCTPERLPLLPS